MSESRSVTPDSLRPHGLPLEESNSNRGTKYIGGYHRPGAGSGEEE